MSHEPHDHYFRLAKREGYRSRAAYKLIEIDDRKKILKPGDAVLDCGAAPGSWLQVATARIGARGMAVGVDLEPIAPLPAPNVRTVVGDLETIDPGPLLALIDDERRPHRLFDVVLSDMAPRTTGDRSIDHHRSVRLAEVVLDRCPRLLGPDGNLACKVFEGEAYPGLLERVKEMFRTAKGFRPQASRGRSTEMYLVALGYLKSGEAQVDEQPVKAVGRRGSGPSRGWGPR